MDEQRKALFAFVKGGKAFAGAHCAADTFYKVPEYGEMVGAYFDGHPWTQEVHVNVEDDKHPATAHLGQSFQISDEIYQFRAPYDRTKLHVLLSLDTGSVDLAKPEVHRKDKDFALAWCRDYDKGRVFYTALGHRPELWKDERYLTMLDGGFRWAMRMTGRSRGGAWRRERGGRGEGRRKRGRSPQVGRCRSSPGLRGRPVARRRRSGRARRVPPRRSLSSAGPDGHARSYDQPLTV
jgi:type 1 glutamine amidotransferase